MKYIFLLLLFYGGKLAQRSKEIYPNWSSQKSWDSTQGILFHLYILWTETFSPSPALDDSGLAVDLPIYSFIHSLLHSAHTY